VPHILRVGYGIYRLTQNLGYCRCRSQSSKGGSQIQDNPGHPSGTYIQAIPLFTIANAVTYRSQDSLVTSEMMPQLVHVLSCESPSPAQKYRSLG
jgi:hypothetical protein